MASESRLSVQVSPKMAEAISDAVESGEYASRSEVVQEALREWKLRRPLNAREEKTLKRLWDEGIKSGPARSRSIADIKREARRRLTLRKG